METPGANLNGTIPESEEVDPANDHEAKSHLNTLMDAHHILNDPDKMKRVHAVAGRHDAALKGIKSVSDLKDAYKEKYGLGHLASAPAQQNDMQKSNNNGSGATGNKGGKGAAKPHMKSSPKQVNDEKVSGFSSSSGDDGN